MNKSYSSYIIPLKKTVNAIKAIVLKYPNGYGFIGGRVEGEEDIRTSLQREIAEELGDGCPLLKQSWVKIEKTYSFDIKKDSNRARRDTDIEEQAFFYCFIDDNVRLEFVEECKEAKVEEIDLEKIATNEFLQFQYFISYAKANITSDNLVDFWKFGNTDREADKLFSLVCGGKKTATSSVYNSPLAGESKSMVSVRGQRSYITNSDDFKKILIEITNVEIKKFCEVDEDFARKEGEGDLSLNSWKETHKKFFSEELEKQGKEFNEDILLLCEEFKVIKDKK